MDDRLEKALEFSNYRMTIENQKKNLKIRMETQQTFMYQKGTWRADQELAFGKYNESMNEFLMESNKLAKARNIKKVMDW